MNRFQSLIFFSFVITACSSPQAAAEPNNEILLTSDIKWEQLNPARGDKSPKAATLWGNRQGIGPTGFLVEFVDGFSSPPHIHNVSYRGIVISGLIHNDDPDAADMWMPAGSYWTQPKGEVHITAAKGSTSVAYIEIEKGPYLVLPGDEAFDSGERPVNLDISNIIWLDTSNTTWIGETGTTAAAKSPEIAFLWGDLQDDQLNGTLAKLPAGSNARINSEGFSFRAVVILGKPEYQVSRRSDAIAMEPGSYFSSKAVSVHHISPEAERECIIYVRSEGKFSFTTD